MISEVGGEEWENDDDDRDVVIEVHAIGEGDDGDFENDADNESDFDKLLIPDLCIHWSIIF